MDINSVLDKSRLRNKCGESIQILKSDISCNEIVLDKIQEIIGEGSLQGQAFDTFVNQMMDYSLIKLMNVEADEEDIKDFNILLDTVDESYYGSIICPKYEEALMYRDEYQRKAESEKAKASEFDNNLISNPYEAAAKSYQQSADYYQREASRWKAKMDRFDEINSTTSNLFKSGKALREVTKDILDRMEKKSITGCFDKSVVGETLSGLSDGQQRIRLKSLIESEELSEIRLNYLVLQYPDVLTINDIQAQIDSLQAKIDEADGIAKIEMQKSLDSLINQKIELMRKVLSDSGFGNICLERYDVLKSSGFTLKDITKTTMFWLYLGTSVDGELPQFIVDDYHKMTEIVKWKIDGNIKAAREYYNTEVFKYIQLVNAGKYGFDEKLLKELIFESCCNFSLKDRIDFNAFEVLKAIGAGLKEFFDYLVPHENNIQIIQLLCLLTSQLAVSVLNSGPFGKEFIVLEFSVLLSKVFKYFEQNEYLKLPYQIGGDNVNSIYTLMTDLSFLNPIDVSMIQNHYNNNVQAWEKYKDYISTNPVKKTPYDDGKFYIEYQEDFVSEIIGMNFFYGKKNWKSKESEKENFGKKEFVAGNGTDLYGKDNLCGLIAVYNAITWMEDEVVDFPALIKDFEEKGLALNGMFGTAPYDIREYFEINGYDAKAYDVEGMTQEEFKTVLDNSDVLILTDYNVVDAAAMHTMAITIEKTENDNGEIVYTAIRHNDSQTFSMKEGIDEIYGLVIEYTEDSNKQFVQDGVVSVIGVSK